MRHCQNRYGFSKFFRHLSGQQGLFWLFDLIPTLTRRPPSGKIYPSLNAEIAQLVEHATENCRVHSSILCLGTDTPPNEGCFILPNFSGKINL